MKSVMMIAVFAGLLLLGTGCTDRVNELEQQKAAAEDLNKQLNQDMAAKDEYIDNISDAINDVYTSIEDVKAKEKSILRETNAMEGSKKLTNEETRARLIDRIGFIRETLGQDHKRLTELQGRLSASKRHYGGLQKMVASLKKTVEEKDQQIADLGKRVEGLEQEVTLKTRTIAQRDSLIGVQHTEMTRAYYIAGTRDQLEKMGIINKEGGFLWGLLGSTTTLTSNFDDKYFKAIDKTLDNTIEVNAKIDEIVPKRSAQDYNQSLIGQDQSMLTIAEPENFWKDKYLVIITDKPVTD